MDYVSWAVCRQDLAVVLFQILVNGVFSAVIHSHNISREGRDVTDAEFVFL